MDLDQFKNWVTGYTEPITQALLWVIPIIGIIAALVSVIKWLALSDEEKEQKSWSKPLITILKVVLVGEAITIIFKIFGL